MKKENIYIAGPMCFYADGYPRWDSMKLRAQTKGYGVTMPSDNEVPMDPVDLRGNGIAIFENCIKAIENTTAVICNLEFYRGPDVDGGSIFEVGMAYGRGAQCYGYTRDKRPMVWKYQGSIMRDGIVYDQKGRKLPYGHLPFSPNVIGCMKIVEGDFDDCLEVFTTDLEEQRKKGITPTQDACTPTLTKKERPIVYLAGPERFDNDCAEKYAKMKELCAAYGFDAIVPTDDAPGIPTINSDDPYAQAYNTFLRQQQHARNCDIILANLNDFHGWEPDSDTSFECGLAYILGKKCFAYMDSTAKMIDRIPNRGAEFEYRDGCGCNAENFDFPINLMFAACMPIFEGDFSEALKQMAASLQQA